MELSMARKETCAPAGIIRTFPSAAFRRHAGDANSQAGFQIIKPTLIAVDQE
jgi:hypothetical protein